MPFSVAFCYFLFRRYKYYNHCRWSILNITLLANGKRTRFTSI
jgi:hypothetical protein